MRKAKLRHIQGQGLGLQRHSIRAALPYRRQKCWALELHSQHLFILCPRPDTVLASYAQTYSSQMTCSLQASNRGVVGVKGTWHHKSGTFYLTLPANQTPLSVVVMLSIPPLQGISCLSLG